MCIKESVEKYKSRISGCDCPDYAFRKGSHIYKGVRMCKHMKHQLETAEQVFQKHETTMRHDRTHQPWCYCGEFTYRNFDGCRHLELLEKIEKMRLIK